MSVRHISNPRAPEPTPVFTTTAAGGGGGGHEHKNSWTRASVTTAKQMSKVAQSFLSIANATAQIDNGETLDLPKMQDKEVAKFRATTFKDVPMDMNLQVPILIKFFTFIG